MARLEDLHAGVSVKGIRPAGCVTVVDVRWYGSVGAELTYRDAAGGIDSVLLYRGHEPLLNIVPADRSWSFGADGAALCLVAEAYRLHLAYRADVTPPNHSLTGLPDHGRGFDPVAMGRYVQEQLVLEERALAREAVEGARTASRGEGEADPVQGFLLAAVQDLGGRVSEREPGCYEIDGPLTGSGPAADDGARLCVTFDGARLGRPGTSVVELVGPGHPLLNGAIDLVLERHRDLLKEGAVLVDPADAGEELRVVFCVEHAVQEVVADEAEPASVLSRQLHWLAVDAQGTVQVVGRAPHLSYRPLEEAEVPLAVPLRQEGWIREGTEEKALQGAVTDLAPRHFEAVRHRQKELTARAVAAVRNRLREDAKAAEGPSGPGRDQPSPAADEVESQLQQHLEDLDRRRSLFPMPPTIVGGALVVPGGRMARLREAHGVSAEQAEAEPSGRVLVLPSPDSGEPDGDREGYGREELESGRDAAGQWGGILEQMRQEELEKEQAARHDEPLHADDPALFSLIPDLVRPGRPAETSSSGSSRAARPDVGRARPARAPVGLRDEWEAHAGRLQGLGVHVPQDMDLVVRNELDGGLAVWVPAGKFEMGSKTGARDEKPVHLVSVHGFYMDVGPVTNEQYARYARAMGRPNWKPPVGGPNHPVVGVNWEDARSYGEWAGKRLPTEAEWEKSARGADGRIYPWGNEFDRSRANVPGTGSTSTSPVGAFPEGGSPYGVLELTGNVWEWVADWYDAAYYASPGAADPAGPGQGEHRVARGGSWICHANYLRTTTREHHPPIYRSRFVGFRCANS